jgi:hypothetical protein
MGTKRIGLPGEQFNIAAKTIRMARKYYPFTSWGY